MTITLQGLGNALARSQQVQAAEQLAVRRSALEEQLAEARAAVGKATLDGGTPDFAALRAAEQELAALSAAESEQARRERQLADETRGERLSRLKAQYAAEAAGYFAEIEKAERAAGELASHIRTALAHADMMRVALAASEQKPKSLGANEIADRFSWRISLLLRNITHPARFGKLKLDVGALGMAPATQSWAVSERDAIDGPEQKDIAA